MLLALFGAMVPVAAFWAPIPGYAWGGERAPSVGADASRVAIRVRCSRERRVRGGRELEVERCVASRGGRAEDAEGAEDPDERSLADVAV